MKRVAKFQEGGEVTPPFVRRRQAREEAARAAEAEGDGRGAMQERFRNFFRRRPLTQEEADILEAYRTNRDVSEIRREREAGGRAAAPAPATAPAPAAPAPAAPSRRRQVQPPPRPSPAMPAPAVDMQTGDVPGSRAPTPSGPAAAARMREIDMQGADAPGNRAMSPPARPRPRPAQRPAPRPRYSEADIARIRSVMEGGDIQPEQPGFFERLGLRRTNETGMEPGTVEQRRNYLGSGAADTNVSYNKKGGLLKAKAPMKRGGMIKPKGHGMKEEAMEMKGGRYRGGAKEERAEMMMKKGGKAMMYREGGKVRQGMQSPKAQEARAEMAEDVMRRERARDPISDKERKAGRAEAAMDSGPLTDAEKERMRASGFKKGGMIKPKAPAKKMKSGGKVAPKKMMKGGMTSKPKKMMGGGRAMYAKGGMAKGCK